jgi:uncharacterized protein YbjT (DUF2867 family)
MIVVAGGTGRLGSHVVRRLVARGEDVRVMTRDLSRSAHLDDLGVELVTGDVREPGTLPSIMQGADVVLSAVHGFGGPDGVSPESVDRDGNSNLIAAAEAACADVVLMSALGASLEHPMDLHRAKYAAEQRLRGSRVRWTVVRSAAFVEAWAEIIDNSIIFGRGDNPINFVSVQDVAAVVERAVTDPGLRGRVIEVGGPQNLTLNQLAAMARQIRGRPASTRHVPRWLLRAASPFNLYARAGLALDTHDMAYGPVRTDPALASLPVTDLTTALAASA